LLPTSQASVVGAVMFATSRTTRLDICVRSMVPRKANWLARR
jgi:hypothetical protein